MGSVQPCPLLENTLMETKRDVREDIYFISDSVMPLLSWALIRKKCQMLNVSMATKNTPRVPPWPNHCPFPSLSSWISEMDGERARASQWASKRISSSYICLFRLWGFIRINKVVTTPGTLEKDTFMCTGNDAIFFTYFCQMSFPLITWFWEVWRNLVFIILFSDSTIFLKRN